MLNTSPEGDSVEILKSVGSGGANQVADVYCVQLLLNVWRTSVKQPEIAEDGRVGPETINAITAFQRAKTGWVDGRVDPGGRAWRALHQHASPLVNEAMAFITVGIATTYTTVGYEVEVRLPLSEKNLLKYYEFRQQRRK